LKLSKQNYIIDLNYHTLFHNPEFSFCGFFLKNNFSSYAIVSNFYSSRKYSEVSKVFLTQC